MIELPAQGSAYFASDLHLSEDTPHTLHAFEQWMLTVAQKDTFVFLLGDVFEVWYGDDYTDPITERVALAIRNASQRGCTVFFMHGNRDFLMGSQFAKHAAFQILPDPTRLRVNGCVVLVTHGDQLCTDDIEYQKFRQQSRTKAWQEHFLGMPLEQRVALAKAMRKESHMHKTKLALSIMDVSDWAVAQAFETNNVILHGHTHRSAIHLNFKSQPVPTSLENQQGCLEHGMRVVLPDWDFEQQHTENNRHKGGFLKLTADGHFELFAFH